MKPTREEIMAARTAKGGWTREQLAVWGVAWPPHKGWIDRLLETPTSTVDDQLREVATYLAAAQNRLADLVQAKAADPEFISLLAALSNKVAALRIAQKR